MNKHKPLIHLFRTPGGYYIFDVNKNAILKTTPSIYEYLWNELKSEKTGIHVSPEDIQTVVKMKEGGFLSDRRVREIIHPCSDTLQYYLENKLNNMVIQVTQQCNFRCKYCTFSGNYQNRVHSNKKISLETALKGIDFLMSHSTDSEKINIGFYGGEPLLEFELIKKCIDYSKKEYSGREITYNITTNGTILNDEIIEFFLEHKVTLAVSLDGPREIHDKNRRFAANECGTFDALMKNIEMLKSKYPEFLQRILFNVVLDEENPFKCIDSFFMNYDTLKDNEIAVSSINPLNTKKEFKRSETFYQEQGYELFKVYLKHIGRLDKDEISKLGNYIFLRRAKSFEFYEKHSEALPERCHHGGPCLAGVSRLFMNVDGYFYPCERVSESCDAMIIGHIDSGFDLEKTRNVINIGKLTEDNCKNCWALTHCEMCATFCENEKEFSREVKLSHCKMVRGSVEETMKEYCVLREFGFSNENKEGITL